MELTQREPLLACLITTISFPLLLLNNLLSLNYRPGKSRRIHCLGTPSLSGDSLMVRRLPHCQGTPSLSGDSLMVRRLPHCLGTSSLSGASLIVRGNSETLLVTFFSSLTPPLSQLSCRLIPLCVAHHPWRAGYDGQRKGTHPSLKARYRYVL